MDTPMIKTLIRSDLHPEQIINTLKTLDLTTEVKHLAALLHQKTADDPELSRGAAILSSTNIHTGTLTLYYNASGNISLKAPDNAPVSPQLYTVPGNSILFAINAQSYRVQLYEVADDYLILGPQVTVDADNPLLIDGTKVLFDSNPTGNGHPAFIGSLNFPDKSADIRVFERRSLRKCAWFPHDKSAAHYLVSLELLEAVQDPDSSKVAEELIYHYHPAVAWKAFQLIYGADPCNARRYVPQLRKLQNTHLNRLLDQHLGEVA